MEDEIEHLISCLNVSRKTYTKSEVICHAGNRVHEIWLVLSESVSSSTFFDLLLLKLLYSITQTALYLLDFIISIANFPLAAAIGSPPLV